MDTLTKEARHKAMSRIRSRDTSIEVRLRKALWHRGFRYRKNWAALPGRPDIAVTKYKIAVFCDGELFHGKDWDKKLKPQLSRGANAGYWIPKIERNIRRDMEATHELESAGWIVLRFWGREIQKDLEKCVAAVEDAARERREEAERKSRGPRKV